jgi:hypothetical protein
METGCCLGSEGNGVSVGGKCEGGPGPSERGKDKQLMPSKNGDNMEKDEEGQSNWACWRRSGANRVSNHLIELNLYRCDCRHPNSDLIVFFFSFRRINHMSLKPLVLILCLHVAEHHAPNNTFVTEPVFPLERYSSGIKPR